MSLGVIIGIGICFAVAIVVGFAVISSSKKKK